MKSPHPIAVVGVSHSRTPLALRESISLDRDGRHCARILLHGTTGRNVAVLSTCNRTEVILSGTETAPLPDDAELRSQFMRCLPGAAHVPESHIQILRDTSALTHLFRLAVGLESLILGEVQILTQMRDQFAEARGDGTLGPRLQRLLDCLIASGRRIRHRTGLARQGLGTPRVVAERILQRFGNNPTVAILGRSELATQISRKLRLLGNPTLITVHRCPAKARAFASHINAQPLTLQQFTCNPTLAGALVAAAHTGLPELLAPPRDPRSAPSLRMVLDLSVPRTLAPQWGNFGAVEDFQDLETLAALTSPTYSPNPLIIAAAAALAENASREYFRPPVGTENPSSSLADHLRPVLRSAAQSAQSEEEILRGLTDAVGAWLDLQATPHRGHHGQ